LPAWWLPYVVRFIGTLQPLTSGLRLTVTSGFRSRARNAQAGGKPNSQHLVGLAFDFTGPDVEVLRARARAAGLVPIDEGDHLHIQAYPAGTIPPQVFTAVAVA
jgi:hypothetical protein